MFLDITRKLDNPDFTHSITSFVKTYENIKTDSAMVSALSSFVKSQTKARGCKRQRSYLQTSAQIVVQPTAVLRKKTSLGGRRVLSRMTPQGFEKGACLWKNWKKAKCSSFHCALCGGEHVPWGDPVTSPHPPHMSDTHLQCTSSSPTLPMFV